MRRLILALLVLALATGAVAAIATGHDSASKPRSGERAAVEHHRGHHGLHGLLVRAVLRSYATRLGVEPKALRRAVREIAREQRRARLAELTAAERKALRACRRAHRARRGCDKAAAKAAIEKLRPSKAELAAMKTSLADSLAQKLGLTPAQVLDATRAELVARLDQAVKAGLVSDKGRELAVGCFDAPGDCDLAALRAEVRFPGHHRKHRRR